MGVSEETKSVGVVGIETEEVAPVDNESNLDEKAIAADYKADAVEAENAEHNMGVLEAMQAYPMASFWAFVMSCTIVNCLSPISLNIAFEEDRI